MVAEEPHTGRAPSVTGHCLERRIAKEDMFLPPSTCLCLPNSFFSLVQLAIRSVVSTVHCPLSTVHGGARLQPKLIGRLDPSLAISSLFPQKAHNSVKTQAQDISTSAEGALQIPR